MINLAWRNVETPHQPQSARTADKLAFPPELTFLVKFYTSNHTIHCYKTLSGDQPCQCWVKNQHFGDQLCLYHQGQCHWSCEFYNIHGPWKFKIQYSPDYPTFGYPTFRFIRRAVSERSILSTVIVRDWILSTRHLLTLNNKGRRPLQTYYCSGAGVTLPQRKGRRLRSKYPNFLKNKLFHLQIYIALNTTFVCEIFSFDAILYFLRNLIIS
jgi:hypothetical protein